MVHLGQVLALFRGCLRCRRINPAAVWEIVDPLLVTRLLQEMNDKANRAIDGQMLTNSSAPCATP